MCVKGAEAQEDGGERGRESQNASHQLMESGGQQKQVEGSKMGPRQRGRETARGTRWDCRGAAGQSLTSQLCWARPSL